MTWVRVSGLGSRFCELSMTLLRVQGLGMFRVQCRVYGFRVCDLSTTFLRAQPKFFTSNTFS